MLEEATACDPHDPRLRYYLALCAIEAGDIERAAQQLDLLRQKGNVSAWRRRAGQVLAALYMQEERWSDAADLILSSTNEGSLLPECLFRARRFGELESVRSLTPRLRFWQAAGYARQGRREEALAAWREVVVQEPKFEPARKALAGLLRHTGFYYAKAANWEAAAAALAEAQQTADGLPIPNIAPVVEALIFLLAGQRQDAIRTLGEAQRRDPTNGSVAHAIGLACYHTARAWEGAGCLQNAKHAWENAIAAFVACLHNETFRRNWQVHLDKQYQAEVSEEGIQALSKRLEEHIARLLSYPDRLQAEVGSGHGLLFEREMRAADLLSELGGFPLPGTNGEGLVCGPLMIQLLGLERTFGEFVGTLPVREERAADPLMDLLRLLLDQVGASPDEHRIDSPQRKRLIGYFSQLGIAQTLLDLDRAQDTLTALSKAGCPRCQAVVKRSKQPPSSSDEVPVVCAETCPDFDTLNPGYAGLQSKGRLLRADAVELAVEARFNLAQSCITAGVMDVQAATNHWREAIRLCRVSGDQERTQRRIVETTLGRVQALEQKARLDEAVALLEAAEAVCDDRVGRELVGRLANVLTDRAITAGNETPPRWEAAVADLRRAFRYNLHAVRPLLNLGIALRNWAVQKYEGAQPKAAIDLLQEAVRQLQEGLSRIPGHVQLEEQCRQAQSDLRVVGVNYFFR